MMEALCKPFADLKPTEQARLLEERYQSYDGNCRRTRWTIAQEYGLSSRTADRILRLNHLIPAFRELVDRGDIALQTAEGLSFLTEKEQEKVWDIIDRQGLKLTPKMASELRMHTGELTLEKVSEVLDALLVLQHSVNGGVSLKLPVSICDRYFSRMSTEQMTDVVEQALDAWFSGKGAAYVQS